MVSDFKGRLYEILEIGNKTTLLKCIMDNSHVRIRNYGWEAIGFTKD